MRDSHQRGADRPPGRRRWAERSAEAPRDPQLRPFERQLREALEDELLAACRAAGPPTSDERLDLDGFAAQMRASPAGASDRDSLVGAATEPRSRRDADVALAQRTSSGPSAQSVDPASPASQRLRWSPRWAVAAVAATLLFVFTWTLRDQPDASPLGDVYLGATPEGAADPGTTFPPLPAELTWDMQGETGVVCIKVFDLEGDPRTAVYSEHTAKNSWVPPSGLPRQGEVRIERAADDGFGRVEVLCVKYSAR